MKTRWMKKGWCRVDIGIKRRTAAGLAAQAPGAWRWVPGVAFHHQFLGCTHGYMEDAASVAASCRCRKILGASRRPLLLCCGDRQRIDRCMTGAVAAAPGRSAWIVQYPRDAASLAAVIRASAVSVMKRYATGLSIGETVSTRALYLQYRSIQNWHNGSAGEH
jgi:hypothetical protein